MGVWRMIALGLLFVVGLVGVFAGVFSLAMFWQPHLFAQTVAPSPAPPSCENELARAQDQMVQLRKAKAQAEFQAAAVEEVALGFQKEVKTLQAKIAVIEKAAASPATSTAPAAAKTEPKP